MRISIIVAAAEGGVIGRDPRPLPTMRILDRGQTLFDFVYDDFELSGYDPHPHIKAEVAI